MKEIDSFPYRRKDRHITLYYIIKCYYIVAIQLKIMCILITICNMTTLVLKA